MGRERRKKGPSCRGGKDNHTALFERWDICCSFWGPCTTLEKRTPSLPNLQAVEGRCQQPRDLYGLAEVHRTWGQTKPKWVKAKGAILFLT